MGAGLLAVAEAAATAARKALAAANVEPQDVQVLIYAGVCREQFEPATACRVAAGLGIGPGTAVYDISNACLGVLNGIVDMANRIELGQMSGRAGGVLRDGPRDQRRHDRAAARGPQHGACSSTSLATLTGGSGAVAVLVTDGSFGGRGHRLLGGMTQAAPQHHGLCRWGLERAGRRPCGSSCPPIRSAC